MSAVYGAQTFISSDGEVFNLLRSDVAKKTCMIGVNVSALTVEIDCPLELELQYQLPVSSFEGEPYDFAFITSEGDAPWALTRVMRNWLPVGDLRVFDYGTIFWISDSYFVFSPSAFGEVDDAVVAALERQCPAATDPLELRGLPSARSSVCLGLCEVGQRSLAQRGMSCCSSACATNSEMRPAPDWCSS